MHLHESVRGILKEQRYDDILREAFLYDVRRLEEAREYSQALLSEGVISENIDDRHLLDEGIFDTIKALGKNVATGAIAGAKNVATGAIAGAKSVGTKAVANVKGALDKAKAQGNEAEAARVQAQIAQLQSRLSQLTGNPAPAAAPAAAAKRPGLPAKAAPAKPAPLPTAARGAMAKSKAATTKATAANKTIVNQAASEVVAKIAKDDPKQLARLQGLAQTDPSKLAAEYNKAVQQNSSEVKSELADTPETKSKPGLLGKIGAWAKKNPVKAGLGLAALGAIGTAAAIGSGGVLPLLTTALLGAGKGAAAGAIGGAVKGAIGQGIANKKDGGKFFGNLKQMGKAALKSAGKGAAIGAAVGAGGAIAGKALAGVSKIAGGLSAGGDKPTATTRGGRYVYGPFKNYRDREREGHDRWVDKLIKLGYLQADDADMVGGDTGKPNPVGGVRAGLPGDIF